MRNYTNPDDALEEACKAHWPSWRNMRPDVAWAHREQMRKAIAAFQFAHTPEWRLSKRKCTAIARARPGTAAEEAR